jgi:hypothetical protein
MPFWCFTLDGPYGPGRVKELEILKPAYEYLDGVEPNVQIIVRKVSKLSCCGYFASLRPEWLCLEFLVGVDARMVKTLKRAVARLR